MPIHVLHSASGVLAIAKPAGLATQAPPGIESVESLAREHLFGDAVVAARAAGTRRHPGGFLGVPHRLDRSVSGVLLLATTPRAARQLSRQFERQQVAKTYLAIVSVPPSGIRENHAFEWRDTIRKIPEVARAEIVPDGIEGGRDAITTGRVLASRGESLLLVLEPRTGRMHQLRAQAAVRGMPVVGDSIYGGDLVGEANARTQRIALHAWRIRFADPDTAYITEVVCPLPTGSPWEGWDFTHHDADLLRGQ